MMDFTLPESQQAVAALAAEILAAPDPWKELARAGLLDVILPRRARPHLPAHRDRQARPLPQSSRHPDDRRAPRRPLGQCRAEATLLPGVASGELLLTAAIREPSHPQPDPPATTITNGTLTGTKLGVPYAEQASLILVPALP